MVKTNTRTTRAGRKGTTEENSNPDLDTTIQNINFENLEENFVMSNTLPKEGSEQMWGLINRRLEELEQKTRKIMEEDRRYYEQQMLEKDQQIQRRIEALESSMSRTLEVTNNVTQCLEERENRIQAQVDRLETAHTRVAERVTDQCEQRMNQPPITAKPNIKYILPEFNGEGSPIKYMRQIKQYWEVVRPRNCDMEYLIEKSLSGTPYDWWLVVKGEVTCLNSFLQKFQQRYWGEKVQHEIKKKLEFGTFKCNQDHSRAEYAIKVFATVNELTPPLEPREVITKLARHFNDEIKYAIIGRGIDRYEPLIELLEEFDRIGGSNPTAMEAREGRSKNPNFNQNTWRMTNQNSQRTSGNHGHWTPQPTMGGASRPNAAPGPRLAGNPGGQRPQLENNAWRQPQQQLRQQQPNTSQFRVQNIEMEQSSEYDEISYAPEDTNMETGNEREPRQ